MELAIAYGMIYIIEAIIFWHYCSQLFELRHSRIFEVMSIVIGYVALFTISFYDSVWINVISFFIIDFILIYILCHIGILGAVFQSLMLTAIMGLSELLSLLAGNISGFFSTESYIYENRLMCLIIIGVISKSVYWFIIQMIIWQYNSLKKFKKRNDKVTFVLVCNSLLTLLVMMTMFLLCYKIEMSRTMQYMIAASSVALFAINMLMFWIFNYNQKKNSDFFALQLQVQRESDSSAYYKMLLKQDENQKIIIHDIKNHLNTISLLNDTGNTEKIHMYIENLVNSTELQGRRRVCDNQVLNLIISRFEGICEEKGISLDVDIRNKSIDYMTSEDITSMFGNLLDNAVESAEKSENPMIELSVTYKKDVAFTVITLINSCSEKPKKGRDGHYITGKNDNHMHGVGMKSIQKIVDRYKGNMQAYYKSDNSTFHTIITLYNSNNEKPGM